MPKVDKKNKKDNEEKDFAHAVISCEKLIYINIPKIIDNTEFHK